MTMNENKEETIGVLESLQAVCNAKADISIGKGKILWAGYGRATGDAIAFLKEQEAVSVEVCGHMFTVKYGHCPKCNEGLDSEAYPHWCGYCGQAVKWE